MVSSGTPVSLMASRNLASMGRLSSRRSLTRPAFVRVLSPNCHRLPSVLTWHLLHKTVGTVPEIKFNVFVATLETIGGKTVSVICH